MAEAFEQAAAAEAINAVVQNAPLASAIEEQPKVEQ